MRFSQVKKYRKKHKLLGALLIRNPVLVMGLDLPFIIAGATTLKNAAAMAIQMFLIHMVTMLLGMITRRKLPLWLRMLANACVATMMMMVAQVLILRMFQGISNALGMYLYLMAVNGMTMLQASTMDKNAKIWPVLSGAFLSALGFSMVAVVTALIREYLGYGTLWGVAVAAPVKLSAMAMPFAGFIIMGFILAAARFLNKHTTALVMRENAKRDARYTKIHVESVELID